MTLGRNDFLCRSFRQRGWLSLLLNLLLSLSRVLWRGDRYGPWLPAVLSASCPSPAPLEWPKTHPAFLISLFSLFASFALMPAPQDNHSVDDGTSKRLREHLEHLVADIKGPSSRNKAQALLVDHSSLLSSTTPRYLYDGTISSSVLPMQTGEGRGLFLLKSTTTSFVFATFSCGWFSPHHLTKLWTRYLPPSAR